MNRQFPRLEISRSRLRHNMEEVISRCTAQGIQVCGVIKGCSGLPEVGQLFRDCGATQLASSRLEQIIRCRQAGVPGPYMLLRIPMLCELDDVARWCDYSLESERATLDAREEACKLIRENLTRTKLSGGTVVRADYMDYLSRCREKFDIIFLDPPYAETYLENAIKRITEIDILQSNGIIVAERPLGKELPWEFQGYTRSKDYKYGKTLLTIYRKV